MFVRRLVVAAASGALASSTLMIPAAAVPPTSGHAFMWGDNSYGQLGTGTTTDSLTPIAAGVPGVLAGKRLTAISASNENTCVVADGQAYCWGDNSHGQLGNNSTTESLSPVHVAAFQGMTVTAVTSGLDMSCAVAAGAAYCWGSNRFGQLGNGSTDDSLVPVPVVTEANALAGKAVTSISAQGDYTCAVADAAAYCWGHNLSGQLGNGNKLDSHVPVAVTGLAGKTVTAVSARYDTTCAVADAKAYCWGSNAYGQMGNTTPAESSTPIAVYDSGVLAGRTITRISTGAHSCAVADGMAFCWGYNLDGQLGDASNTESKRPVAVATDGVLAGKVVTDISTGGSQSCAVADGRPYCWGDNSYGQLGTGDQTSSNVPVATMTSGALLNTTAMAISVGHGSAGVVAAGLPGPPTDVVGVPGDSLATVSWQPPGDDGGAAILDYTVTTAQGDATCTTNTTSCVVPDLSNGTGYTFTVTARNAAGTSVPSAPSPTVTPSGPAPPTLAPPPTATPTPTVTRDPTPQPPGAVTGITARVKKGKATVKWTAVPGAMSYQVRLSKPGGKSYRAWKSTTARKYVSRVRKGKRYRVQVKALNASGTGPIATAKFRGK